MIDGADARNSAVFAVGWLDECAQDSGNLAKFREKGGTVGFFLRRGTRTIRITILRFLKSKKVNPPTVTPRLPPND